MCRSHLPARAALAGVLLWTLGTPARAQTAVGATPPLGALVESLSEAGGYFDTDNLVTNEASYVHVVDKLGPVGGAYIGVGPEQNFTYIARTRPTWAFIVDVRRDNMIHVLLLIGVLTDAETPADYLAMLFSREVGIDGEADLERVARAVASARPSEESFERNLARVRNTLEVRYQVGLPAADWERMARFYRSYLEAGLDISFTSYGRSGRGLYPSYLRLVLARTPDDRPAHFLASSEDYRFVRALARSGRLVPVVGDFGGADALRSVGRFLRAHEQDVSTFYTSNVEFYLARSGSFGSWVENVRSLPLADDATFIRAYFDYGRSHPQSVPGYRSTMVRQPISTFLDLWDRGELHSYWDVCVRGALP